MDSHLGKDSLINGLLASACVAHALGVHRQAAGTHQPMHSMLWLLIVFSAWHSAQLSSLDMYLGALCVLSFTQSMQNDHTKHVSPSAHQGPEGHDLLAGLCMCPAPLEGELAFGVMMCWGQVRVRYREDLLSPATTENWNEQEESVYIASLDILCDSGSSSSSSSSSCSSTHIFGVTTNSLLMLVGGRLLLVKQVSLVTSLPTTASRPTLSSKLILIWWRKFWSAMTKWLLSGL